MSVLSFRFVPRAARLALMLLIVGSMTAQTPAFADVDQSDHSASAPELVKQWVKQLSPHFPAAPVVEESIQAHPLLRLARGAAKSYSMQADMARTNPNEWELGLAARNRRDRTGVGSSTQDQELSLRRTVRLPGKQRWMEQSANQLNALAELQAGEAWHELSRLFSDKWLECARLQSKTQLMSRLQADTAAFEVQQHKRFKAGEISAMELSQTTLFLRQLQLEAAQFESQLNLSKLAVHKSFPSLQSVDCANPVGEWGPDALRRDALSQPQTLPVEEWAQRILKANHRLELQVTQTELLKARSAFAQSERVPDPSVGFSVAREQDGAEQIVGLQLSVPLGGGTRSAQAQLAQNEVLQSDLNTQILRSQLHQDAVQVVLDVEQTRQAAYGGLLQAELSSEMLRKIERAYLLGEGGATELQLIRQQAMRDRLAASDLLYAHLKSKSNLLIDTHYLWDQK